MQMIILVMFYMFDPKVYGLDGILYFLKSFYEVFSEEDNFIRIKIA